MGFGPTFSMILEWTLAALLLATLFCCASLERRLRLLRKDQESLNDTVRALNAGIAAAQASLGGLRSAAKDADEHLGRKLTAARALADELSLLSAAGERIASRIESAHDREPRATRTAEPAYGEALRAVR